jgi:hypothetical protein
MAPYFAGRIGHGWDQLGARTSDKDLSVVPASLKKRADDFKMFYADTALFGADDATVCGLAFFGANHVLFATDAPFDPEHGPMYIRDNRGRRPAADCGRGAAADRLAECGTAAEAADCRLTAGVE